MRFGDEVVVIDKNNGRPYACPSPWNHVGTDEQAVCLACHPLIPVTMPATVAVDRIAALLNRRTWTVDTLEVVAAFVRMTGRQIDEPDEQDEA